MIILSASDVGRLLPMREAIDVAAHALAAIAQDEGTYPPRMHVTLARGDALVMPGYDGGSYLGVKIATIHPGNLVQGKPGTRATYVLVDAEDGEPRLVCDGSALTALRTGAASGLATRRLARTDAVTLAIFGAGSQANAQVDAMFAVRPIDAVRVVTRNIEHAERFVALLRDRHPQARIERSDRIAALAGADIVVTATNSYEPVFEASHVDPGSHVNAIGSFRPDMCEVDPALFLRARVFVEQRGSALAEAGEIIEAIARKYIVADDITEIGAVGEHARTSVEEITVFKTVGHAALDLFTAVELLRRASASG
ncbi:MAG TPA: ornithine cyclodeaminase [Casimicrobiaceae bacterium]|nr:ornithine cyclodeaminase [Casimicrobiaceae bacterium]